jgi:hypothetical protein
MCLLGFLSSPVNHRTHDTPPHRGPAHLLIAQATVPHTLLLFFSTSYAVQHKSDRERCILPRPHMIPDHSCIRLHLVCCASSASWRRGHLSGHCATARSLRCSKQGGAQGHTNKKGISPAGAAGVGNPRRQAPVPPLAVCCVLVSSVAGNGIGAGTRRRASSCGAASQP